jgi:hypothetical protein
MWCDILRPPLYLGFQISRLPLILIRGCVHTTIVNIIHDESFVINYPFAIYRRFCKIKCPCYFLSCCLIITVCWIFLSGHGWCPYCSDTTKSEVYNKIVDNLKLQVFWKVMQCQKVLWLSEMLGATHPMTQHTPGDTSLQKHTCENCVSLGKNLYSITTVKCTHMQGELLCSDCMVR